MGTRTIQARLTTRILAVVVPALVVVAVVAVVFTARALERADFAEARARAGETLRTVDLEAKGGDESLSELLAAEEEDGLHIAIERLDGTGFVRHPPPIPSKLLELAAGSCGAADDANGLPLRACAAMNPHFRVVVALDVADHVTVVRRLIEAMIAFVLVVAGVTAWAIGRAVRGTTSALGDLARWSERELEDLPGPPPPGSDTQEVSRLGVSFEKLVHRLIDALERERANGAHIAHELRTPLTTLLAELDAIPTDPSSAPYVLRIRGDVQRLGHVVDALLVLARPAVHATVGTIVNLADLVRALAPPETTVTAPDEALVDGDERLLRLAVQNLLDNAVKHAGAPATRIELGREGDTARLTVIDDGAGVADSVRPVMFDRYWRGRADGDGTGLGLALVRAVARRHGGDANAAAGSAGRGLSVTMTFRPIVAWHDGTTG